jgi:hypothetical protein
VEELPFDKRFHFRDGSAKSLKELKEKIETISYDEFYNYVNEGHNHFANWIEHVLHDEPLSRKLRQVTSIVETVEILNEHLHKPKHPAKSDEDFQARIEEQLFGMPEPVNEPPAVQFAPRPAIHVEPAHEEPFEPLPMDLPEPPQEFSLDEPRLPEPAIPSYDELEFQGRIPGAPVTTHEPAHTPITKTTQKPTEEHMRFVVKQFMYGFLMGIVVGLILGRIVSMFI